VVCTGILVTVTDSADGPNLLARAVIGRRKYLRLRQADVEDAGGVSIAVLRVIESAGRDNPQRKTFNGLDQALDWPPGAAQALFAARRPFPGSDTDDVETYVEALIHGEFDLGADQPGHAEREVARGLPSSVLIAELARRVGVDPTVIAADDAEETD
jgi:hypothetical protein